MSDELNTENHVLDENGNPVLDDNGNPVVDSPQEADQNASAKLNTVEANNVGDENRDGTQDDAENAPEAPVNSASNDSDVITHPDVVGETPDSDGQTVKDVISRADYVELAKNQFNLTQAEAEELFDQTNGESYDEDIVEGIKSARTVNVQKTVEVDAGLSHPLNAEDAEREASEKGSE